MKKTIFGLIFFLTIYSILAFSGNHEDNDMKGVFPDIKDWSKKGSPEIYTPDNLYEYINGAADAYLSYDFQKLATLTYENKKKESISIDVYRHSNKNNGFGIYAQEKPVVSDYLKIGTQGYYEKGVLNFFMGKYYVKINSFDIKKNERSILIAISKKISKRLDENIDFPRVIKSFPEKGKVKNSEHYIAKNFLGHHFLYSAFVAEYKIKDRTFKVFIIEADDNKKALEILENYVNFVKEKGNKVKNDSGIYQFFDPYYKKEGKLNIRVKDKYVWGLFTNEKKLATFYLSSIHKSLF